MTIQAVLSEVIKYCNLGGVEVIKITGSDDNIIVQCHDEDKTLYVDARIKTPLDEIRGEFGITNIKMLSGLLGFSHFKEGSLKVITRKSGDLVVPTQIEFKGKGSKSLYNLMDAQYIPQQAKIATVPWEATISPTKDMLAEFQEFAGLYSEIDKHFHISVTDGVVNVAFGQEASSTHSGTMKLTDTEKKTISSMTFPVDKFVMLMKLAINCENAKLLLTSKGLLGVDIETDLGVYKYYLRQAVR